MGLSALLPLSGANPLVYSDCLHHLLDPSLLEEPAHGVEASPPLSPSPRLLSPSPTKSRVEANNGAIQDEEQTTKSASQASTGALPVLAASSFHFPLSASGERAVRVGVARSLSPPHSVLSFNLHRPFSVSLLSLDPFLRLPSPAAGPPIQRGSICQPFVNGIISSLSSY